MPPTSINISTAVACLVIFFLFAMTLAQKDTKDTVQNISEKWIIDCR